MKISKSIKEIQTLFIKNKINTKQTRSNLYLLRTLQIIEKVKTLYPSNNLRILDLGCGYGYNTRILSCLFPESKITGVDYGNDCKKAWDLIQKKGLKIKFINSDARKLPFNNNSFDIVISWGLLEHIGEEKINKITYKEKQLEEEKCVREVHRVLKPNGYFMLNYLPNKFSYIEFITNHFETYSHPKKFTKKEIYSLLKKNDFQLIDISRVHFLPSIYYVMGNVIGNIFNKYSKLINFLDKLLLYLPISFLAQDFEIVVKKENYLRKK